MNERRSTTKLVCKPKVIEKGRCHLKCPSLPLASLLECVAGKRTFTARKALDASREIQPSSTVPGEMNASSGINRTPPAVSDADVLQKNSLAAFAVKHHQRDEHRIRFRPALPGEGIGRSRIHVQVNVGCLSPTTSRRPALYHTPRYCFSSLASGAMRIAFLDAGRQRQ